MSLTGGNQEVAAGERNFGTIIDIKWKIHNRIIQHILGCMIGTVKYLLYFRETVLEEQAFKVHISMLQSGKNKTQFYLYFSLERGNELRDLDLDNCTEGKS